MHLSEALCERELDLEMAEVLSPRETLTTLPFNIQMPNIVVAPVIGVAVAVQALTNESNNAAILLQNLHIG